MSNISGMLVLYAQGRPYYYYWEEEYEETVANYVPNLGLQILAAIYTEIPQGYMGEKLLNFIDEDLHHTLITYNRSSNIQETITTLMNKEYEHDNF